MLPDRTNIAAHFSQIIISLPNPSEIPNRSLSNTKFCRILAEPRRRLEQPEWNQANATAQHGIPDIPAARTRKTLPELTTRKMLFFPSHIASFAPSAIRPITPHFVPFIELITGRTIGPRIFPCFVVRNLAASRTASNWFCHHSVPFLSQRIKPPRMPPQPRRGHIRSWTSFRLTCKP